MLPIIQEPKDGFEPFERLFIKDTLSSVYKKIKYTGNKFIILAYFECGYTQQQIANILKVSQVSVQKRIKKVQERLRRTNIFKDLL